MATNTPQSTILRIPLQAYLSTDHITPATGKTIAITLSKNGGAYANPSGGATNAVEIASGSYYVDVSTTDTGTLGPLFVLGQVSGIDNVVTIYNVVKATNGGLTALPDTAVTTNASLITSGTGTDQAKVTTGLVSVDGTSALTESYAAIHVVPTVAQLLFEIRALLSENSVSGTTVTTKKINGSTTAHTYNLDSSTAPTTITTAS